MNESTFLKKLNASRISYSKSSERYTALPCTWPPLSGTPFYYAEAVEDFSISHPYHMERSSLNAYMILCARSGHARLCYRDKEYMLSDTSAVFCDLNYRFRLEVNSSFSYFGIYINGPSVFSYFQQFYKEENCFVQLSPVSECNDLCLAIKELCTKPHDMAEIRMSKSITDLLTLLLLTKSSCENARNLVPRYVSDVKKIFDTQFAENFTLDTLAKTCRISKYQLSHEFKKHVGMSPINYLIDRRIREAKRLLADTDETVNTIGMMVGIENVTHFINLFKKNTGMTPLQYRKTIPADTD